MIPPEVISIQYPYDYSYDLHDHKTYRSYYQEQDDGHQKRVNFPGLDN
jgi:hypothetical protein